MLMVFVLSAFCAVYVVACGWFTVWVRCVCFVNVRVLWFALMFVAGYLLDLWLLLMICLLYVGLDLLASRFLLWLFRFGV